MNDKEMILEKRNAGISIDTIVNTIANRHGSEEQFGKTGKKTLIKKYVNEIIYNDYMATYGKKSK